MTPTDKTTTRVLPTAFVMNMFYTGLGIARSLGERGIPVVGLSAHPGVYGNYTRRADVVLCPDSRSEPTTLLEFLVAAGRKLETRGIIFPTRDDDVVFLDRYRTELEPYFHIIGPRSAVLAACLDKGATSMAAEAANVPVPRFWVIEQPGDLKRIAAEASYPCVLKPLAAHHWRQGDNWELVGARKAIRISNEAALLAEYKAVARAEQRALLQELVPGGNDCLCIVACYLDRNSRWAAGFNTQKVLQIPEEFGTGCIVQSVSRPELFERTARLLQSMGFTGIAEVEYKWDGAASEYKLIEINPRPWDQHRLGVAAGVDLIYLAYCEHAQLTTPEIRQPVAGCKWVAEDALVLAALRWMWRGGPRPWTLLRMARGRKIYAIWSARDPMPSLVYWLTSFIPIMFRGGFRMVWSAFRQKLQRRIDLREELPL